MAGKPFKVGRFAHTLRVRLMREHLGVDVDALYEEDLKAAEPMKDATEQEAWDPNHEQRKGPEDGVTQRGKDKRRTPAGEAVEEVVDSAEQGGKFRGRLRSIEAHLSKAIHGTGDGTARDVGYYMRKAGFKTSGVDGSANDKQLEEERRTFNKKGEKVTGFASAVVPTLEEKTIMEHRPPKEQANGELPLMDSVDRDSNGSIKGDLDQARVQDSSGELYGAPAGAEGGPQKDDAPPRGRTTSPKSPEEDAAVDARKMIRKHLGSRVGAKPWTLPVPAPEVDPDGFGDPICDKFWKNMWVACAVHNVGLSFAFSRLCFDCPCSRRRSTAKYSMPSLMTQ
jgi:phospholipase D1/2